MKDYEMDDFEFDKEECDYDHEYDKKRKKRKDQKVTIACGQVCDDCVSVLECERRQQLAAIELDLEGFKHPVVKLDFSSIVSFRDIDLGFLAGINAANASFTIKLFRLSDCCQKICIGTWEFKRYYNDIAISETGLFLAATSDSFCFTKCDKPKCEECVTYLLEIHDTTFDENLVTKLILKNINFNAIAVDKA